MGVKVRERPKGSGQWWIFIDHKGQRKAKKVGSKRSAELAAEKVRAGLALGELKLNEKPAPLFGDLAKQWLEVLPATCKESTCSDYESILRNHVGPVFNYRPVDMITRLEVKDFLLSKVKAGFAPSTVGHIKNVISGVLARAVEGGILEHNPARNLGRLYKTKPVGDEINPFTWGELDALLGVLAERWPGAYPLVLILARTGLRLGEALGLQWDDIDFQGRMMHVRRSLYKGRLVKPKSGKSRVVDMSPQLTETLADLKTRQKRRALEKWGGRVPELVFVNEAGGPIDRNNLRRRVWAKALIKAGLPHHRIHDLRHTYASLRIAKGDNLTG